jgi:hypothetical protein
MAMNVYGTRVHTVFHAYHEVLGTAYYITLYSSMLRHFCTSLDGCWSLFGYSLSPRASSWPPPSRLSSETVACRWRSSDVARRKLGPTGFSTS